MYRERKRKVNLKSLHLVGGAADIHVKGFGGALGVERLYVEANKILQFKHGGIGRYAWGLHVDVRETGRAVRWRG